ncbi:MAG: 3-dehydro-L-gulonate 2-dehydrogenase [Bacteroidia bacterium]
MKRIPFAEMHGQMRQVLLKYGFSAERAELSARLFAEASRDGVYSHGLNRFPRFIEFINKDYVKVDKSPLRSAQMGALEQWDGQQGPGNLNAHFCMNRAIEMAQTHGMGLVALRNTNHWMRGDSYGWQAADAGMMGICFTNTTPNLPPWGATEPVLGNNPLIIAVPRNGGHVVLDTAMTQFSFGKVESYRREGKLLPVEGGFDENGELTRDPAQIEKTNRALPFGFWKGSGLSLMLDLMASMLSGGKSTIQIGRQERPDEYNLSQFFLVIDPKSIGDQAHYEKVLLDTIEAMHSAKRANPARPILYPGERVIATRAENMELGVPVDESYWEQVLAL